MDNLSPIYRIEFFLDAIVNGSQHDLDPIYRVEFFLAKIAGAAVEIPHPLSRMEMYLAQLCGESVTLPQPQSRTEQYLAAICGEDVDIPPFPIYRIEYWLDQWAQGGGGSYITLVGDIVRFMASRSAPFRKLQIALEPIQDLHGYDSPWPAGGGVNKLPPAASFEPIVVGDATLTPYADGHYHVSKVEGSNSASFIVNLATPVEVTTSQYIRYISTVASGNMLANLRDGNGNTLNSGYWGKTSANISNAGTATNFNFYFTASVSGEYDLYPIISNSPVDTFAPYSNICPISGRTSATVTRTGKNLQSGLEVGTFRESLPEGSTYDDMKSVAANRLRTVNIIPIFGQAVTVSFDSTNYKLWYTFFGQNGEYLGINQGWITTNNTVNNSNYFYMAIAVAALDNHNMTDTDIANCRLQVELGSTATTYEPYAGNTYNIQLGDTVYGGTLDVLTGVLTVTMAEVDLGTLDWVYSYGRPNAPLVGIKPSANGSSKADLVCTAYKNLTPNEWYAQDTPGIASLLTGYIGNGIIGLCDPNYTDAQALKTALSGVRLVYELATPIEITLTPQTINSLVGENNVWDDGTITVEVRGEAIT